VEFDVRPKVLVTGMGTMAFPWRITFAHTGSVVTFMSPTKALEMIPVIKKNSATDIGDPNPITNTNTVTAITHVIGSNRADRIYAPINPTGVDEIQTVTLANATGGTFTLTYNDGAGAAHTTVNLDHDITAADLQTALRNLPGNPLAAVTVTQAGSVYTITFVGLGDVQQLTSDKTNLTGAPPAPVPAITHATPRPGVAGPPERQIGTAFSVTAADFSDPNHHMLNVEQELNLETGQAVLYTATGDAAINGLVSGRIYFVEVTKTLVQTKITFYPTLDEVKKSQDNNPLRIANAIEVSLPTGPAATTTMHKFFAVYGADGGKGDDVLILPIITKASLLIGGEGDDILAGSDGADYLDGGKDDDKIFGDGSHTAGGGAAGGDIISGGAGEDRIFGFKHNDILIGGSKSDILVGGSGDDILLGGPGNDHLEVIENGDTTDYDIFQGGEGDDIYLYAGTWGISSVSEKDGGGTDTIDISGVSQNYVHILSDNTLFSTPGSLFNSTLRTSGGDIVHLGTKLENLGGSTRSPGHIRTEWGFGFHQVAEGEKDHAITGGVIDDKSKATLTAFGKPS